MSYDTDPFRGEFDSLEEFADRVSDVLKCPVTIEDASHRLIAYSAHDDYTDPARTATIISRRVPEKVINSLWKQGAIPALLKSREPVRVPPIPDVGLGSRVAVSIWKNDEVIGFIWVLETNRTLSPEEMEWLKLAAKAAKNKVLQLYMRKNKKEERVQELFWKLLTGHIAREDDIRAHLAAMQIPTAPQFAIVVFRFAADLTAEMERQISYLLQTTQQLPLLLYTTDGRDVILLGAPKTDQPLKELSAFIESFAAKMKERFHIHDVQCGFGGVYSVYRLIEKSYREALAVLALKEKLGDDINGVYGYAQLGIYQFFDFLLEKKRQGGWTNPALEKLQVYDRKHHSDLVKTFETFFDHNENVQETADVLNVHPNTLAYRLKRIADIAELDLNDMNQKIKLYIDIKLAKYEARG